MAQFWRASLGSACGVLVLSVASGCDVSIQRKGALPVIQATAVRGFADPSREYGSVLALGDLSGDGAEDLVIGCPSLVEGVRGIVVVVDGVTGITLAVLAPETSADLARVLRFGSSLAVGDFDADGSPDLAVGNPSGGPDQVPLSGEVFVYYGPLDDERFEILEPARPRLEGGFGATLFAIDLDQDGFEDLTVGEPEKTPERVCVFYGPDLRTIDEISTLAAGDAFGSTLASGGDGVLFVGAPQHVGDDGQRRGAAFLVRADGRALSVPTRMDPLGREDSEFAASLAVGDFDGDSTPDQMVAALGGDRPSLYFYSESGSEVRHIELGSGAPSPSGTRIQPVGDVSNDGRDEILILSPPTGEPASLLYSPSALSTRVSLSFPIAAAVSGDFDGDGEVELLVSAPWNYRKDELGISLLYQVKFLSVDVSD